MSRLSVGIAAAAIALGGLLTHALHIDSKANAPDVLKATAQKALDTYKPQAALLVQGLAQKGQAEVLTHANALDLQTQIMLAIDKMTLPDLAKTGLKMAVITGITEANVDALASKGVATVETLSTLIVQKIMGARL